MTDATPANRNAWLDIDLRRIFPLNLENGLAVLILALAVLTRLYGLGDRAVSHDELNAVTAAYSLASNGNFGWLPMEHGPFLMNAIAAAFVMFGDNDFTMRLPAALFSILSVAIVLFPFRRYLGRIGALAGGLFFLISPYMMYYGRYIRNEAFIVVWSLLSIYAILRYLEKREKWILFLYAVVTALHFTDKATAYIYAGAQMIFLVGYLVYRLLGLRWSSRGTWIRFAISVGASVALLATAGILAVSAGSNGSAPIDALAPAIIAGIFGLAAIVAAAAFLVQGVGLPALRAERTLDLILVLGTFTLPLCAAVPLRALGIAVSVTAGSGLAIWFWILLPLLIGIDFLVTWLLPGRSGQITAFSLVIAIGILGLLIPDPNRTQFLVLYVLIAAAVTVGMRWNAKLWASLALTFFGIYAVMFTSFFTDPARLTGGIFQFLSYWIDQQGVARADQPWFYFLLLQIPVYEYLPAIGTIVALVIVSVRHLWVVAPGKPYERLIPPAQPAGTEPVAAETPPEDSSEPVPTISLILFWGFFSAAIFTYAGEKMPQETMTIAVGLILALAWAVAYFLETPASERVRTVRGGILAVFTLLGLLTARTALQATFINYNQPNEYMAYAHGGTGPQDVLAEIQRVSRLTTGGNGLTVAYDNCVRYPYWWYLRHYPNIIDFDTNPTSDILRAGIIVTGAGGSCENNSPKVDALVGEDYISFQLLRMTWHNQDYWHVRWDDVKSEYQRQEADAGVTDPPPMSVWDYLSLVWKNHLSSWFTDPQMRSAIFQIWLNRDFSAYAKATGGSGYTLDNNWSLTDKMKVYIRKDLLAYLAQGEGGAVATTPQVDPYELARLNLAPDLSIGAKGDGEGQFDAPRAIAIAPDGSLYVADSRNNRIERFDAEGNFLSAWGTFASVDAGAAPGGTFNEPWGVAVGPDGSVYVADTWNHRVQKFTADGQFVTMWGDRSTEGGIVLYGPRAIAVDPAGRVYVADTGNKRILVFTGDGTLVTQIGAAGSGAGELNEPVGLAIDGGGQVYVADTWNHRVQIFQPLPDGSFAPADSWEVLGWYGTLPEMKPYLAVDANRHVYLSDPSSCRVLDFSGHGTVLAIWGTCGETPDSLNNPTGLALDSEGGLWVSDSQNNRLVHYPPPASALGLGSTP